MSGRDVKDLFNLHGRHLAPALRTELRRHVIRPKGRVRVAPVLTLARDRISSAEILHRWCGGSRRLPQDLLESGEGPRRVDRLGWHREEVERWFG